MCTTPRWMTGRRGRQSVCGLQRPEHKEGEVGNLRSFGLERCKRQSEGVLASQAIEDGDLRILFLAKRPPMSTTTKGTFMTKECLSWIRRKEVCWLTKLQLEWKLLPLRREHLHLGEVIRSQGHLVFLIKWSELLDVALRCHWSDGIEHTIPQSRTHLFTLLWKGDFWMVNIPNKCPLPAICLHRRAATLRSRKRGGTTNNREFDPPLASDSRNISFSNLEGRGRKKNNFSFPPLSDVTHFLSLWKFVSLYYHLFLCVNRWTVWNPNIFTGKCWKIGARITNVGLSVKIWVKPIESMYGIFTYIYHKNAPNVGKYTIHGFYGK